MSKFIYFFFIILFINSFNNVFANECESKKEYKKSEDCHWLKRVVGIRTPVMIASGTLIDNNFIITNRHVAEDHPHVMVRFFNGEIRKAYPLPNNYPVDLTILSLNKTLIPKKINFPISSKPPLKLKVVRFDQGRRKSRIYKQGKVIHFPDLNKFPFSRIHTNAQSLPGNSGGAVIDERFEIIGFLASGDGNYNEVVPIQTVTNVIQKTDINVKEEFIDWGRNIRICADTLEFSYKFQKKPPQNLINKIEKFCYLSKNKQLFDQVGQTFGRWGLFDKSILFLKKSLNLDPYSPNTLLSLAISFHIKRDIKSEEPIILKLLNLIPEDPQVLRLGVQVAGYLKNKKLGKNVLKLMKTHNPAAHPLAENYLKNAFKE